MNRVGRSVVSAITQTPASGPDALVTTPPRSASPTVTPGGADCWALSCAPEMESSAATTTAANDNVAAFLMSFLPTSSQDGLSSAGELVQLAHALTRCAQPILPFLSAHRASGSGR